MVPALAGLVRFLGLLQGRRVKLLDRRLRSLVLDHQRAVVTVRWQVVRGLVHLAWSQ